MIEEVMLETYEAFGIPCQNNGNNILVVRDSGFEADDRTLPTFKAISQDIDLVDDVNGVKQFASSDIVIDGEAMKVISWEFHGNKREEIVFAVEGDSRGR